MTNSIAFDQKSDDWIQERLGKVTASNVYKVMAKGEGKTRLAYMRCLLDERLTGKPNHDTFDSEDMRNGVENEPLARSWYEANNGIMVQEVGFINHPFIKNFGASPDGLVPTIKKGIEIKCPKRVTHLNRYIDYKVYGKDIIESKYRYQMLSGISCCQYESWDYIDYSPDYDDRQIVITVNYNKEAIDTIEQAVIQFLKELDELEKTLRERMA